MTELLWAVLLRGNLLRAESWDHGNSVSVEGGQLFLEASGLTCLPQAGLKPDPKVSMNFYFLVICDQLKFLFLSFF